MRKSISVLVVVGSLALSCSAQMRGGDEQGPGAGQTGGPGTGPTMPGPGPTPTPCTGLACQIVNCQGKGAGSTILSGVVNIPRGDLPLYNATVYVPNGPTATLTDGPSCDLCASGAPANAVTSAHTDVSGRFSLRDVPAGKDIPLVISLGKWRRQVTIANVPACQSTALPPEQTRLPRNQSEGHIPKIALTTGGADAIECLLRKLGIDDSEFTPEAQGGRVNLYSGQDGAARYDSKLNGGATFTAANDRARGLGWWSTPANWMKYDIVILSCEGDQYPGGKSTTARQALLDYIDKGGRVFASHWHNIWIEGGPAEIRKVATFLSSDSSQDFAKITATIDTSFDKGKALSQWLFDVGASNPQGSLDILNARNTVNTIDASLTQRYVYYNDPDRRAVDPQYFSFNAPVGAAAGSECGRMVFTDMHVSGNDNSSGNFNPNLDYSTPNTPFPQGCVTSELSAQEKALIFLIFDLTSCVQPVIG